jgi:hypothetical protein
MTLRLGLRDRLGKRLPVNREDPEETARAGGIGADLFLLSDSIADERVGHPEPIFTCDRPDQLIL